jgi:hypothetical protein
MDAKMREILLKRKFSSPEYMEEMGEYHQRSLDAINKALDFFNSNPPKEDWHEWHKSDWPDIWVQRVKPNFERMQECIESGIKAFVEGGEFSKIRSTTGSLHGIFRDLDNVGFKWWDFVPKVLKDEFHNNLVHARDIASNIWWTVGEYWEPGEILDEEITGPIDEQELLRYLKPGEKV